jgi:hypothetical protein
MTSTETSQRWTQHLYEAHRLYVADRENVLEIDDRYHGERYPECEWVTA